MALTEAGVRVCAPVHDAILIEAPIDEIDQVLSRCQSVMAKAGKSTLNGFTIRTDASVTRYPAKYTDERGQAFWDLIEDMLCKTCV